MIVVQNGTPKTYKAVHPKEATSNLKQQLREDFDKNLSRAENLADSLSPIFESVTEKTEIELAYVIRGHRNIARKMKDLIASAKKEVLILIWESDLWNELSPTIAKTSDKVETKIAISRKLWRNASPNEKAQARILECPINIVISDMRILVTVSSWENEVAIMTNDKALMTIAQEYYENPKCCVQTTTR
jgi:sugar-specific transcriptional regulator TrmB